MSKISSKNLLNSVIKFDLRTKHFSLERSLIFLYATLVYLVSFIIIAGMLAFGVFFILKGTVFHRQVYELCFIFIGALLITIAYFLIPKFKYEAEEFLDKDRFKTIYNIVNQLSDRIGTRRVDEIVVDCEFNASYTEPYFKKKTILHIGLPLFYILNNDEKVALLAHELSHGANKDISNNKFIGIADGFIKKWYFLIQPTVSYKELGLAIILGPFLIFLWPIRWILSKLILGGWYLFNLLAWRGRQYDEYAADYMASRVSGSDAVINLLEKLHFSETFVNSVMSCAKYKYSNNVLVEFKNKIASVPEMEIRRIKKLETEYLISVDASHPPTVFRIAFMNNKPCAGQFKLSEEDANNIEKELELLRKDVDEKLLVRSKEYALYW